MGHDERVKEREKHKEPQTYFSHSLSTKYLPLLTTENGKESKVKQTQHTSHREKKV